MCADLLALDRRLADAVRQASEPIIGQMKLAWWRDRFAQPPEQWPTGEPLLARLARWNTDTVPLGAMVDGWEALLAEGALAPDAVDQFAAGRAAGWRVAGAALGRQDRSEAVTAAARIWAMADLAQHCSGEGEARMIRDRARAEPGSGVRPRLPSSLRPLAVLAALGRRALDREGPLLAGPGDMLHAMRVGIFG